MSTNLGRFESPRAGRSREVFQQHGERDDGHHHHTNGGQQTPCAPSMNRASAPILVGKLVLEGSTKKEPGCGPRASDTREVARNAQPKAYRIAARRSTQTAGVRVDDGTDDEMAVEGRIALVPDGVYQAKYIGHDTAILFARAPKVFLKFEVVGESLRVRRRPPHPSVSRATAHRQARSKREVRSLGWRRSMPDAYQVARHKSATRSSVTSPSAGNAVPGPYSDRRLRSQRNATARRRPVQRYR